MYKAVPDGTPDEWHCINVAGWIVQVDLATRRQVEDWFAKLKYPQDAFATITVDDIFGSEVQITADALNIIYSTRPEERRKSRALNRLLENERREQGYEDQND